uniref:DM2 domain-containing protein n=1 Tax=viral metagenome TaxID=1070528 RepID=A0A6C0EJ20_9ZZZZ
MTDNQAKNVKKTKNPKSNTKVTLEKSAVTKVTAPKSVVTKVTAPKSTVTKVTAPKSTVTKVKSTKVKSTKVVPEETVVVPEATVVVPEATVVVPEETVVVPEETVVVKQSINELLDNLLVDSQEIFKANKNMVSLLKTLLKIYAKDMKHLEKSSLKNKKRVVTGKKRSPSGFAKPTLITNSLCDFYGVSHNTLVSRTDITKCITKHIKEHDLQTPENRRRFIPDDKLQSILSPLDMVKKDKNGLTDGEKGYTYFNLQKYISGQFIKA